MGENGLPTTFVPGRNLLFFTLAGALAYRRGLRHIVSGVCETDFSGYPDCRNDTVKAMERALNLGMEADFELDTPLMWIDKPATWAMAEELGGAALVELIREETHSCYLGVREARHDWGYGCGDCPAMAGHDRAAGMRAAPAADPRNSRRVKLVIFNLQDRGCAGGFPQSLVTVSRGLPKIEAASFRM